MYCFTDHNGENSLLSASQGYVYNYYYNEHIECYKL